MTHPKHDDANNASGSSCKNGVIPVNVKTLFGYDARNGGRMLLLLAVLVMVLCAEAVAAPSWFDTLKPQLKSQVVIEGDMIRLGDVFDNLGPIGYIEVAAAPAPGQRVIRDAAWLRKLAEQHGLDWYPGSKRDAIVIERAGRVVDAAVIKQAITEELENRRPDSHFEIEFESNFPSLMVGVETPDNGSDFLLVDDLKINDTSGRFAVKIAVVDGQKKSLIRGRLYRIERVPVLLRNVKPGDPIRAGDLGWGHRRQRDIGRDVLLHMDDIIGMTPRRRHRPGQMLTESDLQKPVLVKKGADVTIVLRADHMMLTAQGRARQSGVLGDTIQVENSQSRRPIFAVVEGPRLVGVTHVSHTAVSHTAISHTAVSHTAVSN